MVNSRVSRQWFCDRYAIKALRVHGGGEVLERISHSVGGLHMPDKKVPLGGRDEVGSIVRRSQPSSIDVLGEDSRETDFIGMAVD